MITTLFSFIAAFMMNVAEPVQNGSFVEEYSPAVVETVASEDKSLGYVNLCDSDGNKCMTGEAFRSSSNGRIFIRIYKSGRSGNYFEDYYVQKSNKPYWSYMIHYYYSNTGSEWLYFSF